MGATTATLAEGLSGAATPNDQNLIHAYDRFVWEPWMEDAFNGQILGCMRRGNRFCPKPDGTCFPTGS